MKNPIHSHTILCLQVLHFLACPSIVLVPHFLQTLCPPLLGRILDHSLHLALSSSSLSIGLDIHSHTILCLQVLHFLPCPSIVLVPHFLQTLCPPLLGRILDHSLHLALSSSSLSIGLDIHSHTILCLHIYTFLPCPSVVIVPHFLQTLCPPPLGRILVHSLHLALGSSFLSFGLDIHLQTIICLHFLSSTIFFAYQVFSLILFSMLPDFCPMV